jgi:ribonuclease-3
MMTFDSPKNGRNFLSVNEWLNAFYTLGPGQLSSILSIESVIELQKKLQYNFKNHHLLIEALTHSTFAYENKSLAINSNEKLEFLGDTVINLIVTEQILLKHKELNEGQLSKLRGSLVNEDSFAKISHELNLSKNLLLGKGEFFNSGHEKKSILADALEAIFGAIYLESGFTIAQNIFLKILNEDFFNSESLNTFDFKSRFQELVQKKFQCMPVYKSMEIENQFRVELWIGEKMLASKQGPSKKNLEKELAKLAIEKELI